MDDSPVTARPSGDHCHPGRTASVADPIGPAAATAATSVSPPAGRLSTPGLTLAWTALRRGRRPVLATAEVHLPAGAVVGLVGASGAGKSTLLMALAGILALRCGRATATCGGLAVATVGYVPQRPALAPWLSVRDALTLQMGAEAATTLADMPLWGSLAPLLDRRADALSGGQTQLLAVAGTLARDDPLVLLDEPFAGVDLRHRSALVACVADHRRRGAASVVVLASHLAVDLDALCDWLLVLNDGAVVFAGPREALPGPAHAARAAAAPDDAASASEVAAPTGATLLEESLAALLR